MRKFLGSLGKKSDGGNRGAFLVPAAKAIALWLLSLLILAVTAVFAYKGLAGSEKLDLLSVQDSFAVAGALAASFSMVFVSVAFDSIRQWRRSIAYLCYVSAFAAVLIAAHGGYAVLFGTSWTTDFKSFFFFCGLAGGLIALLAIILRGFISFAFSTDQAKHRIHTWLAPFSRRLGRIALGVTTIVVTGTLWYLIEQGCLGRFDLSVSSLADVAPMVLASVHLLGVVVFVLFSGELTLKTKSSPQSDQAALADEPDSKLFRHRRAILWVFLVGAIAEYALLIYAGISNVLHFDQVAVNDSVPFLSVFVTVLYTGLIFWGAPALLNPDVRLSLQSAPADSE